MFKIKLLPFLFLVAFAITFQACVKTEFDEPPAEALSDLVANITLADLKASIVDEYMAIEEDLIIEGIVVSSDEAGNFYKVLYIQDATGGAVLGIDANDMFVGFPVGRTIFVKLNGLTVQDNNGFLRIGSSVSIEDGSEQLNRMPLTIARAHIEKGPYGEAPTPRVVTMGDLNDDLLGTLVQLEDVQFTNEWAGGTYADSASNPPLSFNAEVEDCSGNSIILRNSGFASFASLTTPTGKGTLTGVFSKFGSDYQLFIRDTNDVEMDGPRCGETISDLEANTTIAELWDMHTSGEFETISEDMVIGGTVISSDASGNFFKVLYIEDATAAVRIIVNAINLNVDYPIGRNVFVKMNGLTLGDDNGALAIGGGVENNNGTDRLARIEENQVGQYIERGEAGSVNATVLTLDEINDSHLNRWIRLNDVQFTNADAGQTFADAANQFSLNRTIEDCEKTIVLRSSGYADFADALTPSGKGSVEAILSIFQGTYQLFINDTNDLNMTGERCDGSSGGGPTGGDNEIEETFSSTVDEQLVELNGWYNIVEEGSASEGWFGGEYQGAQYAEASAYQSIDPENIVWLITPAIDMDETKTLQFKSNQHHWASSNNGQLSVWISSDFDGTNVENANWEEINCTLPTADNSWYEWVDSGTITLNDYFSSGEVHIGFRYEGAAEDEVTGFQLDDVTVAAQ